MTAALPPHRRGFPPGTARKVGRGSLASAHAGTRLPIAVIQNTGRSPSVRRIYLRNNVFLLSQKSAHTVFLFCTARRLHRQRKRRHLTVSPKNLLDFLRRHYPHQVLRVMNGIISNLSRLSASSPFHCAIECIITLPRKRCKNSSFYLFCGFTSFRPFRRLRALRVLAL